MYKFIHAMYAYTYMCFRATTSSRLTPSSVLRKPYVLLGVERWLATCKASTSPLVLNLLPLLVFHFNDQIVKIENSWHYIVLLCCVSYIRSLPSL